MEWGGCKEKMEEYGRDSGKMEIFMDGGCGLEVMINMWESGKKGNRMDTEHKYGMMVLNIKESGKKIKNMDREHMLEKMAGHIQVNGKMGKKMEKRRK